MFMFTHCTNQHGSVVNFDNSINFQFIIEMLKGERVNLPRYLLENGKENGKEKGKG